MARPRASEPQMRHHLSGQAAVSIGGKDYYLGKWASPEASARHAYLIAEYKRNGCVLPHGFDLKEIEPVVQDFLARSGPVCVHLDSDPITVGQLAEAYRKHVQSRYSKPHQKKDQDRRNQLIELLFEHDAKTLVDQFGPIKLKSYRQRFIEDGTKSRKYINKLVCEIRSIFRWGVGEELVNPEVVTRLECVSPLVGGEASYETSERKAVPLDHVRATIKYLSPVVRDMLRVQLATGMRPSEVCKMRSCDIDRNGDVWLYKPNDHKTAWKGHYREVPLLGDAREAIENYLNRPSESYLFSPREAMAWLRSKQSSERKGYGSYKKLKDNPKRQPGEFYDTLAYTKALRRAAKAANVPVWTAYQIRHLVGTVIGESLKLEDAKALLGHSDLKTTQIYAKATTLQAIRAAQAAPKIDL